jgi:hypothetical protein
VSDRRPIAEGALERLDQAARRRGLTVGIRAIVRDDRARLALLEVREQEPKPWKRRELRASTQLIHGHGDVPLDRAALLLLQQLKMMA